MHGHWNIVWVSFLGSWMANCSQVFKRTGSKTYCWMDTAAEGGVLFQLVRGNINFFVGHHQAMD